MKQINDPCFAVEKLFISENAKKELGKHVNYIGEAQKVDLNSPTELNVELQYLSENPITALALHPSGKYSAVAIKNPAKVKLQPCFRRTTEEENLETLIDVSRLTFLNNCHHCIRNKNSIISNTRQVKKRGTLKENGGKINTLSNETDITSINGSVDPKGKNKKLLSGGDISCLAWNPSGDLLAAGLNNGTICLINYNEDTNELVPKRLLHDQNNKNFRIINHLDIHKKCQAISDCLFLQDDYAKASLLLSCGGNVNHDILVTDVETSTPFQLFHGHTACVNRIHSSGGCMFVTCSDDRTIRFWDLRSSSCTNIVKALPFQMQSSLSPPVIQSELLKPTCVLLDDTERILMAGHENGTVLVYDIRGNKISKTFKIHSDSISSLHILPSDQKYLITSSLDTTIRVTNLKDFSSKMTNPESSLDLSNKSQPNHIRRHKKIESQHEYDLKYSSIPGNRRTSSTVMKLNHVSNAVTSPNIGGSFYTGTTINSPNEIPSKIVASTTQGILNCHFNKNVYINGYEEASQESDIVGRTPCKYSKKTIFLTAYTKDNLLITWKGF